MKNKHGKGIIIAEQKNARISPRKLNLVVKAIKSLSPKEAMEYLKFLNKKGALILLKVIKQALANAFNKEKLEDENLKFAFIQVLPGPTFKRWRAVSRGRAHSILKRTSHIKVALEAKEEKEVKQSSETKKNDKK